MNTKEVTDKLNGSKVVVMGLGVSGYWAARWLSAVGADVIVSEEKGKEALDPDRLRDLEEVGIEIEAGGHREQTFVEADMVVLSPGVRKDSPAVRAARTKGVRVTGEFELASRFIDVPVVAVTGTNGKSTVTAMIGQVLAMQGIKAFVGGNIGSPLSQYLAEARQADVVVAEVSSFQLETIDTFRPEVAVLLNISRDHLDRYGSYGDYVEAKLRIFQNQDDTCRAVVYDDCPILSALDLGGRTQMLRYGIEKKKHRDAYLSGDNAVFEAMWQDRVYVGQYRLPGSHNLANLLAVGLACACVGVEIKTFELSLGQLKALPHRMEFVGEFNGVSFYNDSKATNVDAAVRAIEGLSQPIILIAGGRHKGASYSPLARAAKGRLKAAVLIGEAAHQMREILGRHVPCYRAESMEETVRIACKIASPGDVVLLSPACSSFDMFSNFEERGQSFKDAVRNVAHG